jgi:hypothetical protein
MLGILLWVDSPLALSEPLVHTGSNFTALLGTTQARRHGLEMNSVRLHAREKRCVYFRELRRASYVGFLAKLNW